jgi:pimeloyl-ACP methyl ester carboxylesterase
MADMAAGRGNGTAGTGAGHSLTSACRVALRTLRMSSRQTRALTGAVVLPAAQRPADGRLPWPIAFHRVGDPGAPRLLLVHGTPGSAAGWAGYLHAPPSGVEVVALDRPGFGASGPEAAVTSLAAQADAVAALLPDDRRAALLLGHSLGGAVAVRVAADQPERVRALILVAAALDPALERIHPLQRLGHWPPLRALLPRAIRNANAELLALAGELIGLAPALARVRCPVFIVHGMADDLVPVANVDYLRSRLRRASRVHTELLAARDHFLPWTAEAEVRRTIAAALAAC